MGKCRFSMKIATMTELNFSSNLITVSKEEKKKLLVYISIYSQYICED